MSEGAPHSSVHVAVRLYGDAVELVAERCHIRAVLLTLRDRRGRRRRASCCGGRFHMRRRTGIHDSEVHRYAPLTQAKQEIGPGFVSVLVFVVPVNRRAAEVVLAVQYVVLREKLL